MPEIFHTLDPSENYEAIINLTSTPRPKYNLVIRKARRNLLQKILRKGQEAYDLTHRIKTTPTGFRGIWTDTGFYLEIQYERGHNEIIGLSKELGFPFP